MGQTAGRTRSPGTRLGMRAARLAGRRYHPATCLWNVATRRETTLTDPPLLADTTTQGAFSPDGTMLAVDDNYSDDHGHVYLWDLTRNRT